MNNNKYTWWIGVGAVVFIAAVWIFGSGRGGLMAPTPTDVADTNVAPDGKKTAVPTGTTFKDYKSGTYVIGGRSITLINGKVVTSIPGSSTKVLTQFFGNEAVGDLNGDKIPDTALILTQTTGDSGVFYYITAVIKNNNGYRATNTILLGDRIAPQTLNISKGELVVNYNDRAPGEPMSKTPSMGVSKYFTYKNGSLAPR